MKKSFFTCPETINESTLYGFSWMEHVLAIPSPLVCVTSYKENGLPNATMQSWCTFSGSDGFHVLFSAVDRRTHMFTSIMRSGQFVVNFPSRDVFMRCVATIKNNNMDKDEITASGLTAVPASKVNAPMIQECFLNLECELAWSRELAPGGYHDVFCGKVIGVHMDEARYDAGKLGRYGETGYLYNIHRPINPDTGDAVETQVGIMQTLGTYDKL